MAEALSRSKVCWVQFDELIVVQSAPSDEAVQLLERGATSASDGAPPKQPKTGWLQKLAEGPIPYLVHRVWKFSAGNRWRFLQFNFLFLVSIRYDSSVTS